MGGSQSTSAGGRDMYALAMTYAQRQMAESQPTTGGCACVGGFFGGAKDGASTPMTELKDYEESLAAKTKETLIRGIARALATAGVKVDPEGDLDTIAKVLVETLPNPKRGKTFKADAVRQEKTCRQVADALNNVATPGAHKPEDKLIDTSMNPENVCQAVGRFVHSLATGVNAEFLEVYANVKRVLRNLEVAGTIMETEYNKLAERASKDTDIAKDITVLDEIYRRARSQHKIQMEMLKNFLDIQLAPAHKLLETAMQDESDANKLIERIGLKPGTGDFGDSLAYAVSGLGTVASVAAKVHKALKQVGLSVNDYLNSADFKALKTSLDTKLATATPEDFAKFIEATKLLERTFQEKDKLAAALREKTGGDDEKSTVTKRVERQAAEKKIIIGDFVAKTTRSYDEILAAIKGMSRELGKSIPITDKTDALRDAFERLRDVREENLERALIGEYLDANAREKKERFVSALRATTAAIDVLMQLEMYRGASAHLARLKSAIESLEKTIDTFSDIFVKKYGGNPPADADDDVTGGASGQGYAQVSRNALSLREATQEFAYQYYIARVRANLEQTSGELEAYGEKYTDLLGDAVASRLMTLEAARKQHSEEANTAPPVGTVDQKQPAKAAVDAEFKVKMGFYKALQAIDLYMKAFADGISKDPDSVRDIKKLLDGTQVIARWYNEQTGDAIWKAFESMGTTDFAGAVHPASGIATDINAGRPHYYQKVAASAAGRVGLPDVGVPVGSDEAKAAMKNISDACDTFQALKNLINAFTRIGDKFGGKELRTQVFMSPTQIFKALSDYLKVSALELNVGKAAALGTAGAPYATAAQSFRHLGGGGVGGALASVAPFNVYFGMIDSEYGAAPVGYATDNAVSRFAVEDRYFSMAVKAIAAKIMAVIGVFDMFERRTPLYDLTPTRMILGGADEDVEILDDATELYFRLPRLAEFYRSFLFWNGDGRARQISMLPELEGVFSGLIRLIFQKLNGGQEVSGDYSDTEIRSMIREINHIHSHFKSKDASMSVTLAINAFVKEINRRYGIIESTDMKKYWQMVDADRKSGTYGDVNNTNFAILPNEDEDEAERRAPSDRYMLGDAKSLVVGTKTQIDKEFTSVDSKLVMLREFRRKLEMEFEKVDKDAFGRTSFRSLILQAAQEIKRATTKDAKFGIAMRLIQGTSVFSLDSNKAFMFHETVVVGLNILSSVESLLRWFNRGLSALDAIALRDEIKRFAYTAAVGGVVVAALTHDSFNGNPHVRNNEALLNRQGAAVTLNLRGGLPTMNITADSFYAFLLAEINDAQVAVLAGGGGGAGTAATRQAWFDGDAGRPTKSRLDRALKLATRFITNYPGTMREFLENMFDLVGGSQGLVELRIGSSKEVPMHLDFSKLRNAAEGLLADVKYYLNLLRPQMPKNIIDRFESKSQPGSVFWIEENLVDLYFKGIDDSKRASTLDGIARRVNTLYHHLIRDTEVSGAASSQANLTGAAAGRLAAIDGAAGGRAEDKREGYGSVFSELTFYDGMLVGSGFNPIVPSMALADERGFGALGSLIATGRGTAAAPLPRPVSAGGGAIDHRAALFNAAEGFTPYRSILGAYNQLIAKYLLRLSDPTTGIKIYAPLINAFANGTASQSINGALAGKSFPDLVVGAGIEFGSRGDPHADAVLTTSLALVIQRLVRDIDDRTRLSDHLITTLIDVPLYVKEALRDNLPSFIRLFDILIQKCDYIKQLAQKTEISLQRQSQALVLATLLGPIADAAASVKTGAAEYKNGVAAVFPGSALAALDAFTGERDSSAMRTRIVAIIDSVSAGAYTLAGSCNEVLRELHDQPVFLQTYEGAIETYKSRYGMAPMMPLSLALYALKDLRPLTNAHGPTAMGENDITFTPDHALGSANFKYLYGTRGLLVSTAAFTLDQLPAVKSALEHYNSTSSARDKIDTTRHAAFVQRSVGLLRWAVDLRHLRPSVISSQRLFSLRNLIDGPNGIIVTPPGGGAVGGPQRTAVFPLLRAILDNGDGSVSPQQIIEIVESSDQEGQARKIIDAVGQPLESVGGDRSKERILNIIDLNIIPINVHALMRDLPLVNIYNFSYTFEQMAAASFGEVLNKIEELKDTNTVNTKQMFLRMLVDPFLPIHSDDPDHTKNVYGSDTKDLGSSGFIHRIFRGDNNLGMGVPKFLSDQLFGKALLGSIYQQRADYDESGPGTGAGIERGRFGVGGPEQPLHEALTKVRALLSAVDGVRIRLTPAVMLAAAGPGAGNQAVFGILLRNATLLRTIIPQMTEIVRLARLSRNAAVLAPLETILQEYRTFMTQFEAIYLHAQTVYARAAGNAVAVRDRLQGVPLVASVDSPAVLAASAGVAAAPQVHGVDIPAVPAHAGAQALIGTLVNVLAANAGAAAGHPTANLAAQVDAGPGGRLRIDAAAEPAGRRAQPASSEAWSDASPYESKNPRGTHLTYLDRSNMAANEPESLVRSVEVPWPVRANLEAAALIRFNSRFVRKIFLIVNVMRLIRQKLNFELAQNRSVVLSSHGMVAPSLTEYGHGINNQPYNNPNETFGEQRYSDD